MTMPDFILIGAPKAGTTSLHHGLGLHPAIFMCPAKEPHYFSHLAEPGLRFAGQITSREEYERLFIGAERKKTAGEASTSYFFLKGVPAVLKTQVPRVKLIAVLRNPVDRAFSNFLHQRRDGNEKETDFLKAFFMEDERRKTGTKAYLWYQCKGFYYRHLRNYLDYFPASQILVLFYEEYCADPHSVYKKIFSFLGVDENFRLIAHPRLNESLLPKSAAAARALQHVRSHPAVRSVFAALPGEAQKNLKKGAVWMDRINRYKPVLTPEERRKAGAVYAEDIRLLSQLLKTDLSAWTEANR